jgi:hypothetical protein
MGFASLNLPARWSSAPAEERLIGPGGDLNSPAFLVAERYRLVTRALLRHELMRCPCCLG